MPSTSIVGRQSLLKVFGISQLTFSLFPQLIAGPIVRYQALEDQLRNISSKLNWEQFNQGILFFVLD